MITPSQRLYRYFNNDLRFNRVGSFFWRQSRPYRKRAARDLYKYMCDVDILPQIRTLKGCEMCMGLHYKEAAATFKIMHNFPLVQYPEDY